MTEPTEDKTPSGLRDVLERREAALAAANAQLMGVHLEKIGLDPVKGLGKAVANSYDGEFTADAIAAFAKDEYSHEATATPDPVMELQPEAPNLTPHETARQAQTEVMAGTQAAPPIDNKKTPNQTMEANMPVSGQPFNDVAYYGAVESALDIS